jgi:DNA-binding transcriptional regulator YdaS (Cro superfamily)
MKLIEYLRKFGSKELAIKVGTSRAYLSQIAHAHRQAGPQMALRIEEASDGLVTVSELRPDLSALFESEKSAS